MRISDWSSDVCSSDLDDMPYGLPNGIGPEVTAMKEAGVDYVITAFDQGGALALEQELERQGMSDVLVQLPQRSEARRVGKECVRSCRCRWSQFLSNTKNHSP